MPIQSGISTDMTTTRGENAESPISFVEDPGAQEFSLSEYYDTHGNGPGMASYYSNTMGTDDVNDAGWGDRLLYGEYWIIDGQEEYADQDIGDRGHESIAVDHLFNAEEALQIAEEMLQNNPDDEDLEYLVDQIKKYYSEDYGSSSVFFNVNIPDEIGRQATTPPEAWDVMKKDPREALMKYRGGIYVINSNFGMWKLTQDKLNSIINFIYNNIENPDAVGDVHIEQFNPPKYASIPWEDLQNIKFPNQVWSGSGFKSPEYADDVNDLSLTDVWEGAKDVGKSVLQGVGLMDKEQPTTSTPTPQPEQKPEEELPEQPKVTSRSQENIKAIQAYLQNPTPALRAFIGGQRYDGELDGKAGPKTRSIISSLESALNQLFNTRRFSGTILSTSPQDINTALQKAADYRKYKLQKSDIRAQSGSKDERFYKLGKKLISKR